MNHNKLQNFLTSITIPKVKGKPKTFLSIAKQPHYENVLSNIYAFFFRVDEVHDYGDLFVKSLINVINEKINDKKLAGFDSFTVETEFQTINSGRIDILLYTDSQAIIIENKVYHHLNNDLDDYWASILCDEQYTESKVGVILSLHPVSRDQYQKYLTQAHYINITHKELMEEVMRNSGEYIGKVKVKYQVFLDDFNQNITNISKPNMEEKDLSFYLTNQDKINQLVKFKNGVFNHIVSEIETAGLRLDNYDVLKLRTSDYNYNRLVYFVSKINKDLMFTILFEELLSGGDALYIIIDVKNELLKNKKLLLDDELAELDIYNHKFKKDTINNWAHYAIEKYPLSSNELSKLSETVYTKLYDRGFVKMMKALEEKLIK